MSVILDFSPSRVASMRRPARNQRSRLTFEAANTRSGRAANAWFSHWMYRYATRTSQQMTVLCQTPDSPEPAPPFMPRPSSSRPALAASAHTALMMLPENSGSLTFLYLTRQAGGLKPLETKGSGPRYFVEPGAGGYPQRGGTSNLLMRPTSSPEVVHDSTSILDATIA